MQNLSTYPKVSSGPQRQNFTSTQNEILMDWYVKHRNKPYPSTEETKELARLSELQYSQVKSSCNNDTMVTGLRFGKIARFDIARSDHI